MIANLRETTERNAEQDWLNSNLARFSGLMQGQRDLQTVSRLIMSELTPLVGAGYGAFFLAEEDADDETALQADLELRLQDAQEGLEPLRARGGRSSGRPHSSGSRSSSRSRRPTTSRSLRRSARRRREHHRHARPLRGPGDGGDRARVVPSGSARYKGRSSTSSRDDRLSSSTRSRPPCGRRSSSVSRRG